MRRALHLAKKGEGRVSPNPMVGAVIVNDGRIIGEGFHAFYGGGHAEVNAIKSVKEKDRGLLKDSTLYVTLEPCSHYGKTPPCANLIVATGIPRVVVGSPDPNPLVSGKGIRILRDAGVEVAEGILQEECDYVNRRFLRAQTSPFPWIILKWAESRDGYIAKLDEDLKLTSCKISTPLSSVWMHRERANVDAIMVGAVTERLEHPRLNTRHWGGNSPKKYVAEGRIDPREYVETLRKEGISSLMVEGGKKLLESFIESGMYDEIRREISPKELGKGLKAPKLPENIMLKKWENCGENIIEVYENRNHLPPQ